MKLFFLSLICSIIPVICLSYPIKFTDDAGHNIALNKPPERVISISPSITEIICELNAGQFIKGVTYHDRYFLPNLPNAEIVGGFFAPSVKKIKDLKPDVIFYSPIQEDIISYFLKNPNIKLIMLTPKDLKSLDRTIKIISRIFKVEPEGQKLIKRIKSEINFIRQKLSHIPRNQRLKVMRLMGRDKVMTPARDSFQNKIIALAGGIPPDFGKGEGLVEVTREQWIKFNPDVIYGCGGDRKIINKIKILDGWNQVSAIRNNKIYFYPCKLTCRFSAHTGYFVSWLASDIYSSEFINKNTWIHKQGEISSKQVTINLKYVKQAKIVNSYIFDFLNKSLIIELSSPMKIISTLEGPKNNISHIGNHYTPPQCWLLTHKLGFKKSKGIIYKTLGLNPEGSSLLFTGANMDNLTIVTKQYKKLNVYVLLTAGVCSNAQRISKDTGIFYEPGTINMIIMTNGRLSTRAMSRAIITATEAKTAALQDLDIRSSYTPLINQATGTGTDNIIVVEGLGGLFLDHCGGHSKLGELIAKAVYEAVIKAIKKQNKIELGRCVLFRLRERGINPFEFINNSPLIPKNKVKLFLSELEMLLLNKKYRSFVEASLSISDDYEKGKISDITPYQLWCKNIAKDISGKDVEIKSFVNNNHLPEVIKLCFNSILSGLNIIINKKQAIHITYSYQISHKKW